METYIKVDVAENMVEAILTVIRRQISIDQVAIMHAREPSGPTNDFHFFPGKLLRFDNTMLLAWNQRCYLVFNPVCAILLQ